MTDPTAANAKSTGLLITALVREHNRAMQALSPSEDEGAVARPPDESVLLTVSQVRVLQAEETALSATARPIRKRLDEISAALLASGEQKVRLQRQGIDISRWTRED